MLFLKGFRRRRLKRAQFPPEWLLIMETVPLYRSLPLGDQPELREHVQVFLGEKHFEGGAGFVVDDTVRIVIATQACLLLLHRQPTYYPGLSSIIVYPDEYFAPLYHMDEAGIVTEGTDRRSGECVQDGALVLSWKDVTAEGIDVPETYNVVLHEFAHQLDAEEGITSRPDSPLVVTLVQERRRLKRSIRRGHATLLDPYGVDNIAEMFAVATECFFQCPEALKADHHDLYRQLAAYYRQSPAEWGSSPPSTVPPADGRRHT